MKILATLFVCVLVFTPEGNGFLLKKVYLKKSFLPQPVSKLEVASPAFQRPSLIPQSAVLNPNILVKNGNFLSFLSIHILTVISAITFKSFSKLRVNEIPVLKHVLTDQSFMTFSFGLLCSYFLPSSLRSLFINDTVEEHIWRYILPISLILRIISSNNPQRSEKLDNIGLHSENSIIKLVHLPLIIAFLFGTVGSYLAGLSTSSILTHFLRSLSHSFEQIQSAIIPVAALTASYIGGTVNFFETGHFLANIVGYNNPLKSREILDNLNIFAAMDINVMILYFTFLNFLYNKYSQNTKEKFNNSNPNSAKDVSESTVQPVLIGMGTVIAYFLCHQAVSAQRAFPSIPGLSVFLCTLFAFMWNLVQESAYNKATNLISTPSTASLKPWKAANSGKFTKFYLFYIILSLFSSLERSFSVCILFFFRFNDELAVTLLKTIIRS